MIKCAIDSFTNIKDSGILIKYASIIIGVVLAQAVFRFIWRKYLFGLSRKVECDLRNDYFRHIQKLSASFFLKSKTGDLMSRATNDMTAIREFLGTGGMILVDSIVTVSTCLTMMFIVDKKLAFLSLIPMLVICLLVVKFGKLIRKRYIAVQAQLAKISTMVQESISGIRVVQAYVQEKSELARFNQLNNDYIKTNLQLVKISGVLFPFLTFMSGISAALVLWLGGKDVINGTITLGEFVAFNGYLAMLTWPMMALGFITNLISRGAASMTRVDEILNTKPDITPLSTYNENEFNPNLMQWDIEFKDVNFMYPGAVSNSLQNINLEIKSGSTIGIVGPVGSGKSTLGRLLIRDFDVNEGDIKISNFDIKTIPLNLLRNNVNYVEQDPFLFADTIRMNIEFGDNFGDSEGSSANIEQRILNATNTAGLKKDLDSFPDNINTRIGERGVTLSGGQKQRVALARSLIRKSKILILDDTFSNLDTKTEDNIFKELNNTVDDTTIIFIAHRLSTVKDADMIIVLDNGEIVEQGTHHELLDMNGVYFNINKHQTLETDVTLY